MTNYSGASRDDQFRKLLEQNLAYAKRTYEISRQVKRYILWGRVMSFIYLLLIVVPIILGVVYLPTILNKTMSTFIPKELQDAAGLGNLFGGGEADSQQGLIDSVKQKGDPIESYKDILDMYKGQ